MFKKNIHISRRTIFEVDWKARPHEKTKFADRIKVASDTYRTEADELAEKAKSTAVETTSPFVDLEIYKKEIAQIDSFNAASANTNTESKAA